MDDYVEEFLKDNFECFDRFTFDKIFRFLLSQDFSQEDAKDLILCNCALSAIIFQERIYNGYYKKIRENEIISEDLQQFANEVFHEKLETQINLLLSSHKKFKN